MMKTLEFKNNGEWLQFISALGDIESFLRYKEMNANAKIVNKAINLLINWNPKRRKSLEKCELD